MRLITARHLHNFGIAHADADDALRAWVKEVADASWQTPNEVQLRFPSMSLIGTNRLCFNIKGNAYRVIVSVSFPAQTMFLKWVGTHAQYDKINAETVDDFG